MAGNPEEICVCYHCGNRVPLKKVGYQRGQELYEDFDGTKHYEDFDYFLYQCPTCQGVTIFGDFSAYPKNNGSLTSKRIYPQGGNLVPESHKVSTQECVPSQIVAIYEEIWPLRHIAPNAFAGQIRRALEFICRDQNARGNTLFKQLEDLVASGVFPGNFAEITDLVRRIGNIGAHAGESNVDFWDAELLDDFFRSIVEYVYVAPSKIERLKRRIDSRNSQD